MAAPEVREEEKIPQVFVLIQKDQSAERHVYLYRPTMEDVCSETGATAGCDRNVCCQGDEQSQACFGLNLE